MALKTYKYVATDKTNQHVMGTYKAETREQVADYLRSRELFVISIQQDLGLNFKRLQSIQIGGISLKDKMVLVKQMAMMLRSGLPVLQSIEILSKQLDNEGLKDQLIKVQSDIEGGTTLSAAFQKSTNIFSEIQINLLAAGEKSGNMVEVISQIAIDLEKSQELRSKIRSAMIYPIIIFVAIFVVLIILIVFMIPTVKTLYADFNAEDKIPSITLFLIAVSDFLSNPVGIAVIVLTVLISVYTFRSFKNTEGGKMAVAKFQLRAPVFGTLIQKMQLAQFNRLLSMLLVSGVSIIDSLRIVSKSLGNPVYSKAVNDAIENVSKGVPLAVPLANSGVFPLILIRMIATGEQTGNLDKVLADMGNFYEQEVNELTNNLTKLMEPLILLIVGGMVGFLAIAVYLPIYNIGTVVT